MADNVLVDNGAETDYTAATDKVTYSGDTADVQLIRPVHVTGSEGSKTVVDVTSDEGSVRSGVGPGFVRQSSGSLTGTSNLDLDVRGASYFTVRATGTWSGDLQVLAEFGDGTFGDSLFAYSTDALTGGDTALSPDHQTYGGATLGASTVRFAATALTGTADLVATAHNIAMPLTANLFGASEPFTFHSGVITQTGDREVLGTAPYFWDGAGWYRQRGDATNGTLVNLGANNDVTVTGSVTANAGTNLNTSTLAIESGGNLAGAATSLAVIDDWDESDRAKVNPIVGQAGVQGGAGAVSANTQRVAIATDANAISGTVTAAQGTASNLKAEVSNAGTFAVQADTELTTADLNTGAGTDTRAVVGLVGASASGGNLIPGDATAGLKVDLGGDNDVTITSGTVTTITNVVHVDDNAGALTVDGTVTAAISNAGGGSAVNIQDGGNTITVDNGGTFAVQAASAGDVAHDAADSGNPVKVGMKAANAFPTAVANNDRANAISDLWGRQMVTHIDPAQQLHTGYNTTSQQTGTDVITPTSGKKLAITSVIVGSYGTTAGRLILWFGDNADTTYTAGTDQVLLAASFAPSATSKPGLVFTPQVPCFCATADRELHITTDAALSVDITICYYEW